MVHWGLGELDYTRGKKLKKDYSCVSLPASGIVWKALVWSRCCTLFFDTSRKRSHHSGTAKPAKESMSVAPRSFGVSIVRVWCVRVFRRKRYAGDVAYREQALQQQFKSKADEDRARLKEQHV